MEQLPVSYRGQGFYTDSRWGTYPYPLAFEAVFVHGLSGFFQIAFLYYDHGYEFPYRINAYEKGEGAMENQWSYKNYQIKDGLKPGSKHFQYFYVVSENEKKTCNYCVWIVDEALSRFNKSRDFASIVYSQREIWNKWVKGKIDEGDFGNKVLKCEIDGEKEIELSEMSAHLSM